MCNLKKLLIIYSMIKVLYYHRSMKLKTKKHLLLVKIKLKLKQIIKMSKPKIELYRNKD